MVLTKDEILHSQEKGWSEIDTPYGRVRLRNLSYSEYCDVTTLMSVGVTTTTTTEKGENHTCLEVPLQEYNEARNEALVLAVMNALSVDEETWTIEEVEQIPLPLLQFLMERVCELNNIK